MTCHAIPGQSKTGLHQVVTKNRLIIFEDFPISRIFPVDLYLSLPTAYETQVYNPGSFFTVFEGDH